MTFEVAVRIINKSLRQERPKKFSSSWIFVRYPTIYHFIRNHFRTENGHIDWDKLTAALDPEFSKRWTLYRRKPAKPYENQFEVDLIISKYSDKLYTFITCVNDSDRQIRKQIIIAFVRIAQRGNILAQQELVKWLRYIVDDWIEKYYPLHKWKGYEEGINEKIRCCIRCYKYTGSFAGYLFKTLQYSARGMRPLQAWSLDEPVGTDGATRIDFIEVDQETGIAKIFGR